ncbi:hypothetical protein [Spirosoma aerophilum]
MYQRQSAILLTDDDRWRTVTMTVVSCVRLSCASSVIRLPWKSKK